MVPVQSADVLIATVETPSAPESAAQLKDVVDTEDSRLESFSTLSNSTADGSQDRAEEIGGVVNNAVDEDDNEDEIFSRLSSSGERLRVLGVIVGEGFRATRSIQLGPSLGPETDESDLPPLPACLTGSTSLQSGGVMLQPPPEPVPMAKQHSQPQTRADFEATKAPPTAQEVESWQRDYWQQRKNTLAESLRTFSEAHGGPGLL